MEHGNVIRLDISSEIIQIAHENGHFNCYKGDIFNYQFNGNFDTMTLIESDLKKLRTILNREGQILAIIRHVRTLKYWNVGYTQEYQGKIETPFAIVLLIYFI